MNKSNLMIIAHLFDKINNTELDEKSRCELKKIIKDSKALGVIKVNIKDMIYIKDPNINKPLIFVYIENNLIKVNSKHIWNIICNL